MALSTNTYTYAGGAQTFAVNFALGFIQRSDVKVRVNLAVDGSGDPVYTAFTWIDDSAISVTPTLTIGDSVLLERTVSKTALKVNFSNNTDVTPANLDLSAKHGLMVYQELADGRIAGSESPAEAADRSTLQANAAAASAAAALVSEGLADVDAIATAADVVTTNADVVLTNTDATSTAADRIAVAADLVATNQDTIDTAADVVLTNADVVSAEADKVQTGLDRIAVAADLVSTDANQISAAADAAAAAVSASEAAASAAEAVGQPEDAGLTSISGLTTAADKMIYTTGADTYTVADLTAAGRALLDDADAAAQLVTLGAAPLASPTFTGVPSGPTATAGDGTTQFATTKYTDDAISAAEQQISVIAHASMLDVSVSSPTTNFQVGFASITRTDTGNYDFVFSTARASVDYIVLAQCKGAATSRTPSITSLSATGFTVNVRVISSGGSSDQEFDLSVSS